MKLDIILKDYDRFNNKSQKAFYNWYAYINDHRVFGGKMYGFGIPYETFELPDGAYDVEIWRTLRKKDTDYQIIWGLKINGNPVGRHKDMFNFSEKCLRKVWHFKADINDLKN